LSNLSATVHGGRVTPVADRHARVVVTTFGSVRVVLGATFCLFAKRLSPHTASSPEAVLITRSFGVREAVLGAGSLLAAGSDSPSAVMTWAALGALTDAGDLVAALGSRRGRNRAQVARILAATGLAIEGWALLRCRRLMQEEERLGNHPQPAPDR
jgi:hypothetical protein